MRHLWLADGGVKDLVVKLRQEASTCSDLLTIARTQLREKRVHLAPGFKSQLLRTITRLEQIDIIYRTAASTIEGPPVNGRSPNDPEFMEEVFEILYALGLREPISLRYDEVKAFLIST
ncbi:MAG: hypothetical protein KF884_02460 [Fimbriimonadaceae bacterium]|nr:hypothetical protein [Fimbriimonadaceae bacterium]QYK58958.1 MAG: hypothetical protein KF884_02460 [Fimbriimonadaceae bacterium]